MTTLKLLSDKPIIESYDIVLDEKNSKSPQNMYIKGPFMAFGETNKNNREYQREEMVAEVQRYIKEMVNTNSALGELNHPTTAEVDLERACHMVVELEQQGNAFIGKSKVLSTTSGQILRSLINDGVRVGVSTRSLGRLVEKSDGSNVVHNMRLVAVDCVADPSYPKAFVNGILESKQYVLQSDGKLEEVYENFESRISNLPKREMDAYLREQIITFLNKIS